MQPGTWSVTSSHSGEACEAGRVQEHRNCPQPGVEVVDGREHPGRQTGLATEQHTNQKVRQDKATLPIRVGKVWATVDVIGNEYSCNPKLKCKNCGKPFSGGATHIEHHILGVGMTACSCDSPDFKLRLRRERGGGPDVLSRWRVCGLARVCPLVVATAVLAETLTRRSGTDLGQSFRPNHHLITHLITDAAKWA